MTGIIINAVLGGMWFDTLIGAIVEKGSVPLPLFFTCFHGAIVTYLVNEHRKGK